MNNPKYLTKIKFPPAHDPIKLQVTVETRPIQRLSLANIYLYPVGKFVTYIRYPIISEINKLLFIFAPWTNYN